MEYNGKLFKWSSICATTGCLSGGAMSPMLTKKAISDMLVQPLAENNQFIKLIESGTGKWYCDLLMQLLGG